MKMPNTANRIPILVSRHTPGLRARTDLLGSDIAWNRGERVMFRSGRYKGKSFRIDSAPMTHADARPNKLVVEGYFLDDQECPSTTRVAVLLDDVWFHPDEEVTPS